MLEDGTQQRPGTSQCSFAVVQVPALRLPYSEDVNAASKNTEESNWSLYGMVPHSGAVLALLLALGVCATGEALEKPTFSAKETSSMAVVQAPKSNFFW